MAVFKRTNSPYYYYEFVFDGHRVQESAKTTSITIAREAERLRRRELEQARAGVPVETRRERIRGVADAVKGYLSTYPLGHRAKSTVFANGCLAHVNELLGSKLISELSEQSIRQYMKARDEAGACGRTINAELGELSRAIGKPWSILWPRVRKMEERKDVGRALSTEEEQRLRNGLIRSESLILPTFVYVALLSAMRSGEILTLTWGQVDLSARIITVGKAKTSAGTGRQIPMNDELSRFWRTTRSGSLTVSVKPSPIYSCFRTAILRRILRNQQRRSRPLGIPYVGMPEYAAAFTTFGIRQ